jgi:hypothetical protein
MVKSWFVCLFEHCPHDMYCLLASESCYHPWRQGIQNCTSTVHIHFVAPIYDLHDLIQQLFGGQLLGESQDSNHMHCLIDRQDMGRVEPAST